MKNENQENKNKRMTSDDEFLAAIFGTLNSDNADDLDDESDEDNE